MSLIRFSNYALFEGLGAGVVNEDLIISVIQKALAKVYPLTISFVSDNNTFTLEGISEVVNRSRDSSLRKKADLVLLCSQMHEYPISLKRDDAGFWESADSLLGEKFKNILETAMANDKVTLTFDAKSGNYSITPQIVCRANKEDAENVIFGADILPNGGVIKRTFTKGDFSLEGNMLTITCSAIYRSLSDIEDTNDYPYFFLKNSQSRNCKTLGYKGLRPYALTKSRVTSTYLHLPW
jgi:hypothetical protein